MPTYINREEARAFVASMHPEGLDVPRRVYFNEVSNHLAATVIFVAMADTEQEFGLRQLYVAFGVRSPNAVDKQYRASKDMVRENAARRIDYALSEAKDRLMTGKSPSVIDGLQWALANEWKLDDGPVSIYAVNREGIVAPVGYMGGRVRQDSQEWQYVEEGIQAGIKAEFGE
jgi:hypothetical protein